MSFREKTGFVWKSLLTISLVMNLILLFGISFGNQTEPAPKPTTISNSKAIPLVSKGNTNPSILTECDRKLRDCLSKRYPNKTNLVPLSFSESTPLAQVGKLLSPVDAETQDAMLCEIASRTAREQWLNKKEAITTSLLSSLKNVQEQEKNIRTSVEKFALVLGLGEDERTLLEERYRELRLARIEKVLNAIGQNPPDYNSVFQQAIGLFSDEDTLFEDLFGAKASDRIRAAELEGRTAILAIIASLAEISWDKVVGW
jgi:hypothetical protein